MSSTESYKDYLQRIAQKIDKACVTCYRSPLASETEAEQRISIYQALDELAVKVNAQGEEGTKFATALKQTCAHCLSNEKTLPMLTGTKTCGIRVQAWRLAKRPNPSSS